MQLQLILQFRGDARQQFDAVENPVALLTQTLGDTARLDGQDVGPHGANVFLFTNDAQATFDQVAKIFPAAKSTAGFSAAYRQICSEKFRVLWPENSPADFSLR